MRYRSGGTVANDQGGYLLVEILVTIALVAMVLLMLTPLTLQVARTSTQSTTVTQRSAVVTGEVERVEAETFTSLVAGNSCTTFSAAAFPHTRCVTITDLDARTKQITIVVTPLNGVKADTTIVYRHKNNASNPLNP